MNQGLNQRLGLRISFSLAIALGGGLWGGSLTAIAQEREGCFWVNSRGEHIDLSGYCPTAMPNSEEPATGEGGSNVNPADSNTVMVPIMRREGGIPIISVLFNGQPTEMMLDTGASLIVLPQRVATQLQLRPVDSVLIDTASAQDVRMDVAIVNTVQLGSLTKQELPVAISGDHIGIGLLGQNFYSDYDLTIREDVVEFTHR